MEIKNRKYDIIYADPPWRYKTPLRWEKKGIKAIEDYYDTMELEDIKNMNIPCKDNAWLILWTTVPMLKEGIDVLESWGFEYRTMAIWDKLTGLGKFFRIYHEIILIGIKGNPKKPIYTAPSIFRGDRRKHSQKPKSVIGWIEKAFPDMDKIEFFARDKYSGWNTFGNQTDKEIQNFL
tara:strand:- start:681 stop:1214 length:534 start_codon:yes stop_codon:yes gene_type:complete